MSYRYFRIIDRAADAYISKGGPGTSRIHEVPVTDRAKPASTEHLKGSVKEAIGKLAGDARIEAEGRRQKRQGRPKATPRGD